MIPRVGILLLLICVAGVGIYKLWSRAEGEWWEKVFHTAIIGTIAAMVLYVLWSGLKTSLG